jgi:hypothetical protein
LWLGIGLALASPLVAGVVILVMALREVTQPTVASSAALVAVAPSASQVVKTRPTASPSATPAFAFPITTEALPARATEPVTNATNTDSTAAVPATATPSAVINLTFPTSTATDSVVSPTAQRVATATPHFTGSWLITGARSFFDANKQQYRVVGEVTNLSAEPMQLVEVTGRFYDAQGQPIAMEAEVSDFWPQAVVPAAGRVPFELVVGDIASASTFTLAVEAAPSAATLRTDFVTTVTEASLENNRYCLAGQTQNPGSRLSERLTIIAVVYDPADLVIDYRDTVLATAEQLERFVGGQTLRFRICVPVTTHTIERYDILTFGH